MAMTLSEVYVKITADIADVTAKLDEIQDKLKEVGKAGTTATSGIAKLLTGSITAGFGTLASAVGLLAAAFVGLTIAIGGVGGTILLSAIKAFGTFEQRMANVQSVVQASAEDLRELGTIAKDMGEEFAVQAYKAADALYFLGSAGYSAQQIFNTFPAALQLTIGTGAELSMTTEALVNTINAFSLSTKDAMKVADVFASTIRSSQATMAKLTVSMAYVAPIARILNISLEDTAAAMGVLYNRGIQASIAGTGLRMSLTKLASVTTDLAKNALKRVGLSVEDVDPKLNSLVDIIDRLAKSGAGLREIAEIVGVRAATVLLNLMTAGREEYERMRKKVGETGQALKQAQIQLNTIQSSFGKIWSAIKNIFIELGSKLAPYVRNFADYLLEKLDLIKNWVREQQDLFGNVFKIAGDIIVDRIAPGLEAVVGWAIQLGKWTTIFYYVVGEIITLLIKNLPNIGKVISAVFDMAKAFITTTVKLVGEALVYIGKGVLNLYGLIKQVLLSMGKFIDDFVQFIPKLLDGIWEIEKRFILMSLAAIGKFFSFIESMSQNISIFVPKILYDLFIAVRSFFTKSVEMAGKFRSFIFGFLKGMFEYFKPTFSAMAKIVGVFSSYAFQQLKLIGNGIATTLKTTMDVLITLWKLSYGIFSRIISIIGILHPGIKAVLALLVKELTSFEKIDLPVGVDLSEAEDALKEFSNYLENLSPPSTAIPLATKAIEDILPDFKLPEFALPEFESLNKIKDEFKDLMDSISKDVAGAGIGNKIEEITAAFNSMADSLKGKVVPAIKGFVDAIMQDRPAWEMITGELPVGRTALEVMEEGTLAGVPWLTKAYATRHERAREQRRTTARASYLNRRNIEQMQAQQKSLAKRAEDRLRYAQKLRDFAINKPQLERAEAFRLSGKEMEKQAAKIGEAIKAIASPDKMISQLITPQAKELQNEKQWRGSMLTTLKSIDTGIGDLSLGLE